MSATTDPQLAPLEVGDDGLVRDTAWKLRTIAIVLLLVSNFAGRIAPANAMVALSLVMSFAILLFFKPGVERVYLSLSAVVAVSWVFFSVLWSILPSTTARRAISFGMVAVAATVLGSISPSENVRSGIRIACKITIGVSLLLAVVLPGWAISPPDQTEPGLIGLAFQKNQLGFVACIGLAAEGLGLPSRSRKLWFGAYIVAVVLSQSSTALAVMLLVLAFLGIVRGVHLIRDRSLRIAFVTALLAPGLGIFTLIFVDPGALTGLVGKDAGLTGRNVIWATVLEYIAKRPILGYGWNTVWPTQSGGFLPSEVAFQTVRRAGFDVVNAHNGYLDLVLSGGVVALIIFVTILFLAVGKTPAAPRSAWRTAVVLAFAVNSFSESNFSLGFVALLFLLVASRRNDPSVAALDAEAVLAQRHARAPRGRRAMIAAAAQAAGSVTSKRSEVGTSTGTGSAATTFPTPGSTSAVPADQ